MRTLFISNFYPPLGRGGYEEWCQEVALRFLEQGEQVRVLTSKSQTNSPNDPPHLFRELNLEMELASLSNGLKFFTHRQKRVQESLNTLKTHIETFKPDTVLVWGMWNLPFDIPALAEKLLPGRVFYYLGDYWPTLPPQFQNYWEAEPSGALTALPKKILALPAKAILKREERAKLELKHGLFCSNYLNTALRDKGIRFGTEKVIYGAIDTSQYDSQKADRVDDTVQLLAIGRLIEDKGFHTILEAVKILITKQEHQAIHLRIIGRGNPSYEQQLEKYVADHQLEKYVTFVGNVAKAEMPKQYQNSDVFIFASQWPEPFGRVIVEAMASNLAIVASATGGAAEIIDSGNNALTFERSNATDLAAKLGQIIADPALRQKLSQQGLQDAEKFDISRMAAEIYSSLESVLISS